MVVSRVMLLLFLTAQGFDGLFTCTAVHAYGNVLIATWMALVGPAAALFGAKTVAAACGILLYARGMHRTLFLLTVVYIVAAIGPWMMVFVNH